MYKSKLSTGIAATVVAAAATFSMGSAAATPAISYSSDFNNITTNGELAADGWLAFVAVFQGNGTYPGDFKFGYVFDVASTSDQVRGVADQSGNGYINVYSDYDCCGSDLGHNDASGNDGGFDVVVPGMYQKFENLTAEDINTRVTFSFKARLSQPSGSPQEDKYVGSGVNCTGGNERVALGCSAGAFIKTITAGNAQTNYIPLEIKASELDAGEFRSFIMHIDLKDPALIGQRLEIGFENFSSLFGNTGVNYDDVEITQGPITAIPIPPFALGLFGGLLGLTGIFALRKRTKG